MAQYRKRMRAKRKVAERRRIAKQKLGERRGRDKKAKMLR